jgi:NitT/TauT family transport system permease protein
VNRAWREDALPWLVSAALLILWEFGCRAFKVPDFVLPRPSQIAVALSSNFGTLMFHATRTLVSTLIGFGLAIVVGGFLGVFVGSSRLIYKAIYPLLVGFNAVPKVAIVPVLVVWFGIGTVPAVLTAFLLSFFPIAVNVATGLATVEPELEDVLRSLGATRADIVLKVGLPRSLPYFFASLKISITLAFVGAVIAETMASNEGIGMLIVQASSNLRIPLVFAALTVIAAMSVAMYAVFAVIEGRMTGWATRRVDFGIGG